MSPLVIAVCCVSVILVFAFTVASGYFFLVRPLAARETVRVQELVQVQIAEAQRIKEDALKELDSSRRQAILEAKEDAIQFRTEVENENREKRAEIQRLERRLAQKEENLDRREEGMESKDHQLDLRESDINKSKQDLEILVTQRKEDLQRLAGMSTEEARAQFLKAVEDDSRHDAARLMRDIENAARKDGERKARQIVTDVIQRCSVDQTSETTVSVVPLPNDEMKGQIIGEKVATSAPLRR